MKTSKILFTVAAVLALSATPAKAGFVWNGAAGTPVAGTKLHISIVNFEYGINVDGKDSLGAPSPGGIGGTVALVDSVGDEIRGIFFVDSITDFNDPGQEFWTPTATAELTGYFDSYIVSSFLAPTGMSTVFSVDFTGGVQKLFFDDTPDFNSDFSLGLGGGGLGIDHGVGFSDGTLFLDMVGQGGIKPGSPSVTLATTVNAGTSPIKGQGSGFLDIIGGTGEFLFVPDGADPLGPGGTSGSQDLLLSNTITVEISPGATIWPVTSSDPITGIATPEPTSLTLLGIGSLLAGAFYRRNRKTSVVSS